MPTRRCCPHYCPGQCRDRAANRLIGSRAETCCSACRTRRRTHPARPSASSVGIDRRPGRTRGTAGVRGGQIRCRCDVTVVAILGVGAEAAGIATRVFANGDRVACSVGDLTDTRSLPCLSKPLVARSPISVGGCGAAGGEGRASFGDRCPCNTLGHSRCIRSRGYP